MNSIRASGLKVLEQVIMLLFYANVCFNTGTHIDAAIIIVLIFMISGGIGLWIFVSEGKRKKKRITMNKFYNIIL